MTESHGKAPLNPDLVVAYGGRAVEVLLSPAFLGAILATLVGAGAFVCRRSGSRNDRAKTSTPPNREHAPRASPSHTSDVLLYLSSAVGALSDALAFFDAEDRLVMCNDAFQRLMLPAGYTAVIGTTFENLLRDTVAAGHIPAAERDPERYLKARMERHRNPGPATVRHLSNGAWLQVREQRLTDGGTVLIATDVTQIKQKEAEVATKTTTLEATLAHMSEGLSVFDGDLRLVAFNALWKDFLALPDTLARPGADFRDVLAFMAARGEFGNEDPDVAVARRYQQAKNGEPHRFAKWWPSGRYVEIRRTPTPDGGFISVIADLTELKKTEERFKDFAEATSDWVWEQDADLRFTYLSPGVREKSSLSPEDHIGKTRGDTKALGISEEDWRAHMADLAAHRPFRDFRLQRLDARGVMRTLAISGKPIFDAEGRFKGYRGTGTDITERVEAENRAQLTQTRFASAIDSLEDALAIFDANDKLVMCNLAFRHTLGSVGESLQLGTSFEAIVRGTIPTEFVVGSGEKEDWVAWRLERHRNPGEPIQLQRTDGHWIQIREQRLSDGGTAVIGTDITATKQHEQEVLDKSEILERTLANMGEGIIVFDSDLRLIAWNNRLIEMLELPADFCRVGMSYEEYLRYQAARGEFMSSNPEEEVRARLARAHDPNPFQRGRWRPNGRYIELRRNPMPDGGFVALYSDATERKQTENALREAKETAELANRTKTEFLANMSHELRTPLNAIIGFSEIISQEMFGALGSPRYREYAADIHQSGTHLLTLINDILDVSKAEAGKVELNEAAVRIADVIDASVRLIGPRARDGGIHLAVARLDHLPSVVVDERRLKQVLLNLLANAVKFTPAGGRVSVEAENDPRTGFFIRVIDTGIGMAPDDIPKALEPFGQVDSKLSRKYEGTGLGLPLSKALVELHGGGLTITSEVGVGTTVSIALPAARVVQHRQAI